MKTFEYKGYCGSIEVSEQDNCLYGRVLDLPNDVEITYEGETVSELHKDFVGAVDDYLTHCKETGITPHKSYRGVLNVRISPETHSRIAVLANREGMSINAFIKRALEQQVASMMQ